MILIWKLGEMMMLVEKVLEQDISAIRLRALNGKHDIGLAECGKGKKWTEDLFYTLEF